MTAIILLIGFVTDLLIYKSICRVGARPLWRKIYAVTSVLFALFWIVLICLPKRTGSDGSFERLIRTTDIADMTKFISREQLLVYVTAVFRFFGAA